MKHETIQPHHTDIPVSGLSDAEIEARVFKNLESTQKMWARQQDSAVVVFQYPDNRTFYQRLSDWWHTRYPREQPLVKKEENVVSAEPNWPDHWVSVKYL